MTIWNEILLAGEILIFVAIIYGLIWAIGQYRKQDKICKEMEKERVAYEEEVCRQHEGMGLAEYITAQTQKLTEYINSRTEQIEKHGQQTLKKIKIDGRKTMEAIARA